jgi:integrase
MNSLRDNLQYCISQNIAFGTSKKNDKDNNLNKDHTKIYSLEDCKGLRDTVKNLCNYLEKTHPEVTKVKQLTSQLIQEWIDYRNLKWSNRTKETHESHLKKINKLVNKTFKSCKKLDFCKDLDFHKVEHKKESKKRDIVMERKDLDLLKQSFEGSKSEALVGLQLAESLGLRALEIVNFRASYIDIENKRVILPRGAESGTKGGRGRTIEIQDKYMPLFQLIYKVYGDKDIKLMSITEDSYNQAIRRKMKELGLNEKYKDTTNHSIRKLWATELYRGLLDKGYPDCIKTFDIVSQQLGHGENRHDLYKVYIGGK